MARITYQDCRALRHAMERIDGSEVDDDELPVSPMWHHAWRIIHLRCMRCKTRRHIAIDKRGARLAHVYRYPDDYLLPKGEPRVDADTMRLWLAKPNGR